MDLTAIVLVLVLWLNTGEKQTVSYIQPNLDTCISEGLRYEAQYNMNTGNYKGVNWYCWDASTDALHPGA